MTQQTAEDIRPEAPHVDVHLDSELITSVDGCERTCRTLTA